MEPWKERTNILVGEDGIAKLQNATVAVIGLGGVGAFAAEMVCRAGVGNMIILDSDTVNITNKNRQLVALDSTIEKLKTDVMAERLKDINPNLNLTVISQYIDDNNIDNILGEYAGNIDFLIDAIDTLTPKIELIKFCVRNKIKHVSSMGAGAKLDATAIKIADLSKSFNCPLAYILRKKLRKEGISKGFKVVFSEELPDRNAIIPMEERNKKSQVGTISYLPASFGIVCAQVAITGILSL